MIVLNFPHILAFTFFLLNNFMYIKNKKKQVLENENLEIDNYLHV
jgi:hypothetical protein